MDLGNTIKSIRKQKNLSQGRFASECGITQTYLSQIENNQKEPAITILKKIAGGLEIPLPILFFQSLTEEDVELDKREIYQLIGPSVKKIIDEIFLL